MCALFLCFRGVDPQGIKVEAMGFKTLDLGSHIIIYLIGQQSHALTKMVCQ